MIKVAEWGTGMMGQGLLAFILDRPKDIDLVGVIVTNPAKEGKTVGELLGPPVRRQDDHRLRRRARQEARRGVHQHAVEPATRSSPRSLPASRPAAT